MSILSNDINNANIKNIRELIKQKKSYHPHFATINNAAFVLTDYDTFPYPRWWRGVTGLSEPVVAEREAGWRRRHDNCYKLTKNYSENVQYPNNCFQSSCSTTYPCYPKYLQKISDKKELDIMLNANCVTQYR